MRQIRPFWICAALGLALNLTVAPAAPAANTIVNSLTGFTGDSTVPGTQAALLAAGFELASTAGLAEDFSSDPTVVYDANGATFGSLMAGDAGRNYMRTVDSYAFDSYTAEITVTVATLAATGQQVFMGMGSGNITNWGTPDFAGIPSVFLTPEVGALNTNAIDGLAGDWYNPDPPCLPNNWCKADAPSLVAGPGTHRLRMTFDADTKEWVASMDIDYAGGPYVADVSSATYDLTLSFDDGVFIANGWPTNPSKIYFGGDDGAVFKDFSVIVGSAPVEDADFDSSGLVDGRDFLIWQRGFGLSGQLNNSLGDADGNGTVEGADLAIWQGQYGTGGLAAAIAVPEPSGLVLLLGAVASLFSARRRS